MKKKALKEELTNLKRRIFALELELATYEVAGSRRYDMIERIDERVGVLEAQFASVAASSNNDMDKLSNRIEWLEKITARLDPDPHSQNYPDGL